MQEILQQPFIPSTFYANYKEEWNGITLNFQRKLWKNYYMILALQEVTTRIPG